jgi:hypothetical protein
VSRSFCHWLRAAEHRTSAVVDDPPIEQALIQVKLKSTEGMLRYPSMLNEQFDTFSHLIESADTAPTQAMLAVFAGLDERLAAELSKWRSVTETDIPALNAQAVSEKVGPVVVRAE